MTSKRKGGTARSPRWMVSWKAAAYCDMTDDQWKHYRGCRPPCVRDLRPYRFQRTDLDAWMELRARDLWEDWKDLVQNHGERSAWVVMLRRLRDAQEDECRRAEGIA